jgi:tetratricopeptide (TPR) repeat protein
MIWENTKLLLKLYYRPLAAMSNIIDEGNWLYGAVMVAAISLLLQFAVTSRLYESYGGVAATTATTPVMPYQQFGAQAEPYSYMEDEEAYEDSPYDGYVYAEGAAKGRRALPLIGHHASWLFSFAPANFFTTLLTLALLYVPATILLLVMFEPIGSFGLVLRRDYGTLFACTLMAWAAAHLPFAFAGLALVSLKVDAVVLLALWVLSSICFGLLMVCALRTVFGAGFSRATGAVSVSWLSMSIGSHLFTLISPYLFSPFLLFYAYIYFRGEVGTIGTAYRQRQNLRRFLQSATLNPRDAEAHLQLGLIYLQRRQETEAVARFKRAIEIDPLERDAHFQLGRIARERGRLQEAIDHFNVVVAQDERHAQYEVWREIGATYLAASMFEEAREALATYVGRRPFDPEGLYYTGRTLRQLGQTAQAEEMFRQCIEAVKTMPYYRRSQVRKWHKLAQDQLSALPNAAAPITTG